MFPNKKLISLLVTVTLLVMMVSTGFQYQKDQDLKKITEEQASDNEILLWYTDEALTAFLKNAAGLYEESHNVKVNLRLVSGVDYLDEINRATIYEDKGPDLYIASHDMLERATLSGLASKIRDSADHYTKEYYPETALDSVTYHNNKMAYPLYFETAFLLYNKTYLADYVKQNLETEQTEEAGENSGGEGTAEISEEQLNQEISNLIPTNMEQLLTFADGYDAPAEVENVFKWDVSDVLFDYAFTGSYMEVGGKTGDDPAILNINNQQVLDCLAVYQQLNQFFAIDPKLVTYDSVMEEFKSGKTVFTIASTDAVKKLEDGKADGTFTYEYGTAHIPGPTEEYDSKSLSVTDTLAVNGYSKHLEAAHEFADFVAFNCAGELFSQAGKISARADIPCAVEPVSAIMTEYANSAPVPKLMDCSNYWVRLEIMFYNIWTGNDIQAEVNTLWENMKNQLETTE